MISKLGALRLTNPREWARTIRTAMAAAGGRIPDAARSLGVGARTLYRWLDDPSLADVPRVENGMPRSGQRGKRSLDAAMAAAHFDMPADELRFTRDHGQLKTPIILDAIAKKGGGK